MSHAALLDAASHADPRLDGWLERYEGLLTRGESFQSCFYPGAERGNQTPLELVDPVTRPEPGLITRATRIAAMGSCFAAELKSWLIRHGYRFIEKERDKAAASEGGSAAYGLVYTTQGIRQHIEHAFGKWHPVEEYWKKDGVLTDPYRAMIEWGSVEEMRRERTEHAAAVREVIAEADVFIMTMGLVEAFTSTLDGSAFYRFPPRAEFDPRRHRPAWFGVERNVENLERAYALMRAHNPRLRLVLTVSPVPLRASVHPLGAVVADEESKSTLRVAARIFCARHLEVVYFPSFEIVRKLEHRPYLDDNRHVKPEVVARIMRTFMMHFGDLPPTAVEAQARDDARFLARSRRSLEFSFRARYVRERILRALEGAEHAGRRVALMGGGRHSAFVIERCGLGPAALARLVVLDDAPATAFIGPVPVLRPAEARPGDFDSVIASSDSMEAALLARARQWAGSVGESGGPEVIALYEGLPEGPYAAADAA